jgi:DNA polymerase-1
VCAFKGKGRTEADALLQARVARILRSCDYDLGARRVIPWTPDRMLQAWATQEVHA